MSEGKKPYEVGYKKPPKHSQFKKGEPSANPRGRKKKSRNFAILLDQFLQKTVTIIKNGIKKKVTAQEAIALAIVANAAKGNDKAIERIFKLFPNQRPADWLNKREADLERLLNTYNDEQLTDLINGLTEVGREQRENKAAADSDKTRKGSK